MNKKELFIRIEKFIMLFILLLFPLIHVNVGLDFTDTGSAICNFQNFGRMPGKWMLATFLSNGLGALFMKLPGGDTYVGIQVYCSLFIGAMAIFVYLVMRKYFHYRLVFLGVFMALCIRWCPSVVLYNYLTYFLLFVAIYFILRGFAKDDRRAFLIAGILLGTNVFVRFSNLVQAILIIPVIFGCIITHKKAKDAVKICVNCLLGYLAAVAVFIIIISCMYGFDAYIDMIKGLAFDSNRDTTYSPFYMLTQNYIIIWENKKWLGWLLAYAFGGVLLYKLCAKKWMKVLFLLAYGAGALLLMKWFHYWSVFTIHDYTGYLCMSFWGMLMLIMAFVLSIKGICNKKEDATMRILAAVVLCLAVLGPIGTNTGMLASFNNMYMIFPFVLGMLKNELWKDDRQIKVSKLRFSTDSLIGLNAIILMICLFQFVLFAGIYTYGDMGVTAGLSGKMENNQKLAGVHCLPGIVPIIDEITEYVEVNDLQGVECITYGNIPLMSFALDMPTALSFAWVDVGNYAFADMKEEMQNLKEPPVIIINKWYSGGDIFVEAVWEYEPKAEFLANYILENEYQKTFENDKFVIYEVK